MQFTFALASAALVGIAVATPQGITDKLTPTGAAPAGCTGSFDGKFEITVARVAEEKRSVAKDSGSCGSEGTLVVSLEDGSTFDAQGRTGYIASNYQFQFDAPAQAGALFTSGFSLCEGNIMALGSSKTFYQCRSGNFYNLYDRTWAEQCEPVSLVAIPCDLKKSVEEGADSYLVGTSFVQTTIVTALSDGQPQVVTTSLPVPIYSTYVPVSEYTDGQIQVTPTGSAPPPPPPSPSPSPTETTSAAPPPPPETTSELPPVVTSTPTFVPTSTSSLPPSSSSSEVETPTITTATSSSSAPSSPAPPASTSAPPASGSSHVAAGSMGALVVGMLVAFLCL